MNRDRTVRSVIRINRRQLICAALGLALTACAAPGAREPADRPGRGSDGMTVSSQIEPWESAARPTTGTPLGERASFLPLGTLLDRQGEVEVAVTPLESTRDRPGMLVFEVAMNTHSVDLSMNLRDLASLATDSGLRFPAAAWSGGSGHHVTGYLEFDLSQGGDEDDLEAVRRWTLTIRGVDVPERIFVWYLGADG